MKPATFHRMMFGAVTGLGAWALTSALSRGFPELSPGTTLAMTLGVFATLVSAVNTAAGTFFEDGFVGILDTLVGAVLGLTLASMTGVVVALIVSVVVEQQSGTVALLALWLLVWILAGTVVGVGSSIRLGRPSRERLKYGLLGGSVGGLLGGLIEVGVSSIPLGTFNEHLLRAFAFASVGGLVAVGVALAPGFAARAELVFQSSRSFGARRKLSRQGSFPLDLEPCVLGSSIAGTDGIPNVFLIPDEEVQPVHAIIENQNGRYRLVYPDENLDSSGAPKVPVFVDGGPMNEGAPLTDGVMLQVGSTLLQFRIQETR